MFIIALLMAAFAVAFSNLVRNTDSGVSRQEPSDVSCGEGTGIACPTRRQM